MEKMRKNFYMQSDLNPRIKKYADETGFSESQIICLALKQFFDQEDMKRVMTRIKPEDFVREMIDLVKSEKKKAASDDAIYDSMISAGEDSLKQLKSK